MTMEIITGVLILLAVAGIVKIVLMIYDVRQYSKHCEQQNRREQNSCDACCNEYLFMHLYDPFYKRVHRRIVNLRENRKRFASGITNGKDGFC